MLKMPKVERAIYLSTVPYPTDRELLEYIQLLKWLITYFKGKSERGFYGLLINHFRGELESRGNIAWLRGLNCWGEAGAFRD